MATQQSTVARARIHSPNHAGVSQESLLALHPENPERFEIADFGSSEDHLATWRVKPRHTPSSVDPDTISGRLIRTDESVQPVSGDVVLVTVSDCLYLSIYRADKGFVEEANPVEPYRQELVKVCGVVVQEIHERAEKTAGRSLKGPQVLRAAGDYVEDITCTSHSGDSWNARAFVPRGNKIEHEKDELGGFRLAIGDKGLQGLYFAARIRALHGGEAYPHDALPIFCADVAPQDGDVVCAVARVKDASGTFMQRVLFQLSMRSSPVSKLIERCGIRVLKRETENYLLRRYVVTPAGPELQAIDGSFESIRQSRLANFEVLGVVTSFKPWGAHRCRVMF